MIGRRCINGRCFYKNTLIISLYIFQFTMIAKLVLLAGLFSGLLPVTTAALRLIGLAVPPVLTVKAAWALGPGSIVTVRAVVLNGAEMGSVRYIQDADAGLVLYTQTA